ncbi:hypothetical protein [Sphingomonas bacterium]|uniref:hypothetical protein n=1 Tax=Sphingomonas bacterium TaxID=1895847 RepID=UPI00157552C6|nr:hypothetical protein [Sphingomonas bacterium]
MAVEIISPLSGGLRALREVQAPEQVTEAMDRPGGYRVSSAAFRPQSDGSVSVDLEESLVRSGLNARSRYPAMPRAVALVAHRVDAITARRATVLHVPVAGNPHHGEIRMAGMTKAQIRAAARSLADQCEILEAIDVDEVKRQSASQRSSLN